jgi:nucleotide-binding universal stress UspA family protein
MKAPSVPPVRQVAAAVTTSPRLSGVLAEAGRFARRLEAPLLLLHAGTPDPQKEAAFRDALLTARLPPTTRLVWQPGEQPAEAIAAAAETEGADLVIAGVLDRPAAPNATYVGTVARPLAERAGCSVLLLSQPQLDPKPFRRVVVMTDFSSCAKAALHQALWLACAEGAERVEVIALYTAFMRACAGSPARRVRRSPLLTRQAPNLRQGDVRAAASRWPCPERLPRRRPRRTGRPRGEGPSDPGAGASGATLRPKPPALFWPGRPA